MEQSSSSLSSPFSFSSSKRKRDSDSFDEPLCCKRPKNDVFVNYSFEDTGKSFVSHLKGSLTRNGFSISDHTMLPIGEDETSELLKAIEESEIYLIVFSINYAFSIKCLDELVDIMDCLPKFKKKKVFPIFFNVDPSHVKSQQGGSFMEAFQAHESNFNPERVEKWRRALEDAGQLSGLTMQNGDEEKFLLKIVKILRKMQNPQEICDAECPVGIESRAQDIITTLRLSDQVIPIVVVLGISGLGKTTIVQAAYDRISADFDVSCFIQDIHNYEYRGQNWKVDLQKDIISCLTGNDKFPVTGIYNNRAAKIKKLISGRKVLLVLDDVYKFEQLQALGIHSASLGCGSRIIVTTRNKQSLSTLPYIPYELSFLNTRESFELFTRLAFGKDEPVDKNFVEEIVWRAEGLPLVLEVWGRHFKSHERKQWPSVLETLKRIPHEDIQKKLQMSYDSLTNRAKKLFLDIACFFIWIEKGLVIKVLSDEDSGFFPDNEIQYLVDKGLLKNNGFDQLNMHHVIREMGQEVVRQENEDDPGQRTRLMDFRDVVRVLRDCSGTKSVESIRLGYCEMEERVIVQVEAFKKMSNLRFIQLLDYESHLQWSSSSSSNDDMSSFSFKKLKYLEWYRFPYKCIDNIDMGNVVVIKLKDSKLEILWEGFKSLTKLRILDVSGSRSLTKTGNFFGLEKLEKLCLCNCEKLEELHSSIGCLEKLFLLDLSLCTRLERFPWKMIGKLQSLRELNLSYCSNIGLENDDVIDPFLSSLKECCITRLHLSKCNILKISHEVGSLKSLKYLDLRLNRFPSLPDSLCQLHELNRIDLFGCANLKSIPNLPPNIEYVTADECISLVNIPSNISELQFLKELWLDGYCKLESEVFMNVIGLRNLHRLKMRNCNVSQVSSEIGNLVSLHFLDLSKNTFSSLPDSLSNLSKLERLEINDCSQLQLLPLLPSKLAIIEAYGCWSLDVIPFHDSVQTAYNFRSKRFEESFFTKNEELCISLSGKEEVPDWCSYRNMGDVLSFVAPMHLDKKICGVIVCATLTVEYDYSYPYISPTMLNKTKETSHCFYNSTEIYPRSRCVMFYPLNDTTLVVETGDTVILQFADEDIGCVSSCGLSLIYEGDVLDDSILVIKNIIETPTLTVSSEMMTATSTISQFNVKVCSNISSRFQTKLDDGVCSFEFQDNEYVFYNIFPLEY